MANTLTRTEISAMLQSIFPGMTAGQIFILAQTTFAMQHPLEATLFNESFLNTQAFNHVSNRLISHHATSNRPLKKENFEHAIEDAFREQNCDVPLSTDPTRRGADVMIDNVRYSLKTHGSSSNDLRIPSHVDISKFAESRWMRGALQTENFDLLRTQLFDSVRSHLAEYDFIFMLHNHESLVNGEHFVTYHLFEMPKSLFELVYELTSRQLSAMYINNRDRRSGSGGQIPQTVTAKLLKDGVDVGSVSLDGSVEKLRFMRLAKSQCIQHATWKIQVQP